MHPAALFVFVGDRWARSAPVRAGRARVLGLGVAVALHALVGVRLVAIPGPLPAAEAMVELVLTETAVTADADPAVMPAVAPAGVAEPVAMPLPAPAPALAPVAVRVRPAPARAPAAPVPSQAPAVVPSTVVPAPSVPAELITAYHRTLLTHLERYRQYPQGARLRREEGVAAVRFTVDRGGRLLALALERGSGFAALDEEAVATMRRAEPLPALPAEIAAGQLEFVLPLRFLVK